MVGILALLVVSGFFIAPQAYNKVASALTSAGVPLPQISEQPFKLGLDLQGGVHLVYEADTRDFAVDEQAEAVQGVRDVIDRRVNGMGVGESAVQTTKVGDQYRLIIELPGVTDVNQAIRMIGETPILEFKEENNEPPRELTDEELKQISEYNKDAQARAQVVLDRVLAGESFEALVTEFSEDEPSKVNGGYIGFIPNIDHEEISPIYRWAKNVQEGDISNELIDNAAAYNVLRRGAEKEGQELVEASHILICYLGSENCSSDLSKEAAFEKATDLFEKANSSNFEALAIEHSTDPSAKQNKGSLGLFPKGRMVAFFDEAVFAAKVGEIVGPVETQFGYHIIYKTDERRDPEYEISRIAIAKQRAADILPAQNEWKSTGLSGKQLERAEVVTDANTGEVQVSLQFDGEGAGLFKDLTEKYVGKPIAIFLDGEAVSIPVVRQPITDGRAVITGQFSIQEARQITRDLNAGALPVPIELISQQAIGASLGAETLHASLKAGIIALLLVMAFMVLYYRVPGVIAVISLCLYLAVTLAAFKIIGVTLSLSGIAGLVLSIGMAVDANVLIFERLKEELRKGKSLKAAVEEGFLRAWTSIRDGNTSTLITCLLLTGFGSSFVKGFALTLSIGILVSMFTAIVITRIMLRFVVPWFKADGGIWFLGSKK